MVREDPTEEWSHLDRPPLGTSFDEALMQWFEVLRRGFAYRLPNGEQLPPSHVDRLLA